VILILLLAAGAVLVWKLPDIVEGRIYAFLDKQDWERKELSVTKVDWKELTLEGIDLADEGWAVQADRLTLKYSLFKVLSTWRADLAEIAGLKAQFDLVAMEAAAAPPVGAPTGETPAEKKGKPVTLQSLSKDLPVDVITLLDPAPIEVKRGEVVQNFELSGQLAMTGETNLQLQGSGVSLASLSLTGDTKAPDGEADLKAALSVEDLSLLMTHFSPDWAEALGEDTSLDIGKTELEGQFPFRKNKMQFETLDGVVELRSLKSGDFAGGNASVTFAQVEGGAFAVTTTPFELNYVGETVRTVSELVAEVGTGEEWRKSSIQGALKVTGASLFGMPVTPFEMPLEGTLGDIQFTGLNLFSPDLPDMALSGFAGGLKDIGTSDFKFESLGNLLLRVPGMKAKTPSEELEGAGAFPVRTQAKVTDVTANVDFTEETGPAVYEKEGFTLEAKGGMKLDGDLQESGDFAMDTELAVERLALLEQENLVTSLTDLKINGKLSGNQLKVTGEGKLDGETFPVESDYTFGSGEDEGKVTGNYAVGPVELTGVTWVGEFVDALKDVKLSAKVESKGTVQAEGDGMKVSIRNGKLVYPDDLVTANGISSDIGFSFKPFGFDSTMRFHANSVKASDVVMTNVSLTITPLDDGGARIDAFSANLWEGRVLVTKPFVIPADRRNFSCKVLLRGVNTQEWVQMIPNFNGELDAYINGELPFKVTNGRLTFLDGFLNLDKSRPAFLKYDATGLLTRNAKRLTRQYRIYQSAEKALGHLKVEELSAQIFGPDSATEGQVLVNLDGVSVDERMEIPVDLNVVVEDNLLETTFQLYYERVLDISIAGQ